MVIRALFSVVTIIYFLIVVANVVSAWRLAATGRSHPQLDRRALVDVYAQAQANPTAKERAASVLEVPSHVLLWPFNWRMLSMLRRSRSAHQFRSRLALRPIVLWVSLGDATVLVLLSLLGALDLLWVPVLTASVWFVLLSTVAKHLSFILGSLQDRLRRSSLNPQAVFAGVALVDGLALTGAIAILSTSADRLPPTWQTVQDSASRLLNLPQNVADFGGLRPADMLFTAIGIIYYTSLLKAAITPKEFRRTDDDVRVVAYFLANLGEFGRAEDWLDKERDRRADSYVLRARIALGKKDVRTALAKMRRALEVQDEDSSDGAALVALSEQMVLNDHPVSLRATLCREAMAAHLPDAEVLFTVSSQIAQVGDSSRTVSSQIAQVGDSSRFVSDLGVVDPVEYPLTRSRLEVAAGHFDAAVEILDDATPGSAFEEMVRIVTRCGMTWLDPHLTDAEQVAFVLAWRKHELETVRSLVRDLTTTHERALASTLLLDLRATQKGLIGTSADVEPPVAQQLEELDRELFELAVSVAPGDRAFRTSEKFVRGLWQNFSEYA